MKLFKVTVYDYFFEMELGGEFEAMNEAEAEEIAREIYAEELGTTPAEIDVVDVTEIAPEKEKVGAPTTANPQAKNKAPHHEKGQEQSLPQEPVKVKLGNVYTTPSVSEEMGRNDWFRYDLHAAMGRFSTGDWGECCESDAEVNETALEAAGADRIIGVYDTQAGRVWLMAEPWRDSTTILFENEY